MERLSPTPVPVFFVVKKGTKSNIADVEKKLPDFIHKNIGVELEAFNGKRHYFFQPLKDIYLTSHMSFEISPNGNIKNLYLFAVIAVLLLLIACVNFMNLSTARSEKRANEVGIRKVLGANKKILVFQFLGESFLLSTLTLFISLLLVFLLLPAFNGFIGKELRFFQNSEIIFWIAGCALFTGILSGLYPAFYLASFKPIVVLKGKLVNTFSAKTLRKGLVVFQFSISTGLILVGGIIWRQMDFIKKQDLGFKKEQKLIIPYLTEEAAKNYDVFKTEILKNPNVLAASGGSVNPVHQRIFNDQGYYSEEKTIKDSETIHLAYVKQGYLETLGYRLLYGRFFSGNEQDASEIIGVLKDFNFESLHEAVKPFGLRNYIGNPQYFLASLSNNDLKNVLSDIQSKWAKITPDIPFEYSFLDDDFQRNYQSEEQISKVILSFMVMAIFIACLGLFGLASFTTEQRKKEVGIRRVLGASIFEVTSLHMRDFLKLVVLSLVIACPVAYYFGNR